MLENALSENTRLVLSTNAEITSLRDVSPALQARRLIIRSVERKFGRLPQSAHDFKRFEGFEGRVRIEKVDISGLEVWSLRFSEPDKSTPGRDWIADFTTLSNKQKSSLSCRLSCYSAAQSFNFTPSTPGALKEIASALTLHNSGYTFNPSPFEIGLDASIEDVTKEICDPRRWWNVIVVAASTDERHGFDAFKIHRDVMGCASVYTLPVAREDEFSQAIGLSFRVYGGAARTYRPGFSDRNPSESHPVLSSPSFKQRWLLERGNFILANDAFRATVARKNVSTDAPGFLSIRQLAARQRTQAANSLGSAELAEALKLELEAEKEQTEAGLQLALQEQEARREIEAQLEAERAANYRLKVRISALENRTNGAPRSDALPQPQSFDEISDWVEKEYAGKLSLHARAVKALKSAQYHDINHVLDGLDALACEYRSMRLGECDRADFDTRLSELGFSESKSASKSTAGRSENQYYVSHGGKNRFLERHLKKGTSKSPQYCLRIYFFFDENTEEIVVGYLPEHLNTLST